VNSLLPIYLKWKHNPKGPKFRKSYGVEADFSTALFKVTSRYEAEIAHILGLFEIALVLTPGDIPTLLI